MQIYTITGGNIDVKREMTLVYDKEREYCNTIFIDLLNRQFTLSPFFDIIISDTNCTTIDTTTLIRHCLQDKDEDGKSNLNETQLKQALGSLVDDLKNDLAVDLLIDISGNIAINHLLIELLTKRNTDFIKTLPKELLILATGAFNKTTYKAYLNNDDYLKLIATNGNETQISLLVNLLRTRISDNNNVDTAVDILEIITTYNNLDKAAIAAELNLYIGSNTEIAKALQSKIKDISTKINKL